MNNLSEHITYRQKLYEERNRLSLIYFYNNKLTAEEREYIRERKDKIFKLLLNDIYGGDR